MLDIGCNCGVFTIEVAKMGVKKIVGIDLDASLILKARQIIDRKYKSTLSSSTFFLKANIITDFSFGITSTYDTILCMSVTKWIHYNWGDEGIINLFRKVYSLLNPGGYFILEPQPWRSYEKKKNLNPVCLFLYYCYC